MKEPIRIAIDFNLETFKEMADRYDENGLVKEDYIVVMTHKQFETFKIMYRLVNIRFKDNGKIITREHEYIEPTTMGYVFGLAYKVEN